MRIVGGSFGSLSADFLCGLPFLRIKSPLACRRFDQGVTTIFIHFHRLSSELEPTPSESELAAMDKIAERFNTRTVGITVALAG
jgi:hypothetical protein